MIKSPEILIENYSYELPLSKIAQFALEPRDISKLLVYQNKQIKDSIFNNITSFLPKKASLFYNDAKVIPARIFITKESGATIEIFLLKPYLSDYHSVLNSSSTCLWECLIGNKRKWKKDEQISTTLYINKEAITLFLTWHDQSNNIVNLSWNSACKFIDLLEQIGNMPLPPYIKRKADFNDNGRYQTVYSVEQGSVAAPTAGLHFTDQVIQKIKANGHPMTALTLHVSAGTFLPVVVERALDHTMHQEIFSINQHLLNELRNSVYNIAVGTTSVRVLESLYWCANNLQAGRENPFIIEKLTPYQNNDCTISPTEAIDILLNYMQTFQIETITGATSIMIVPGYEFRFIKGLITNFHQPKSTLVLLIAAFIGEDWQTIYGHALANDYRFLSYGDSSILLK